MIVLCVPVQQTTDRELYLAHLDEAAERIEEACTLYPAGEYLQAADELDMAAQELRLARYLRPLVHEEDRDMFPFLVRAVRKTRRAMRESAQTYDYLRDDEDSTHE